MNYIAEVKKLGDAIQNGLAPHYTKMTERETGFLLKENGKQIREKTEPTECAYWKIGNVTYSCLNNPDAILALGKKLSKAKTEKTEKPKTDKPIKKPAGFSWSVAKDLLVNDECTNAERFENYSNYLDLYGLTPAYGMLHNSSENKTVDKIIILDLEKYPDVHGIENLYTGTAVTLYSNSIHIDKNQVLHHIPTGGCFIKPYKHETIESKLETIKPESFDLVKRTIAQLPVLNPKIKTGNGKFQHLFYCPDDMDQIVTAQ